MSLKVEFSFETDSGYPREAGVFVHARWQTLGTFENESDRQQTFPARHSFKYMLFVGGLESRIFTEK